MTLLKCNYLIFTNFFFCYFHSYCYNFKISGKKLHWLTLFSLTSHCFSLFWLTLKAQYVPPGWFEECDHGVSECQSLHDSDTVKTSNLKNVRWKLNLCLLRRHLYTIQCHVTTLWYRSWLFGSFNWPWLPSWIGFFPARWQWQHVRAARVRSSKQNTRANISVFCLQIWPSIRSRAINGFNKCVFGFYSHWKVWYKSEKAFGICSEWHYTTRGLANGALRARCHVSIRQSLSLCNAILNTCPCLLAIIPCI